jgi:tetratricopeptide (TPR) repeat protein
MRFIRFIIIFFIFSNWLFAENSIELLDAKLASAKGIQRFELLRTLSISSRELEAPRSLTYAIQQKIVADSIAQASFQMDAHKNLAIAWFKNGFYDFSKNEINILKSMYEKAKMPEQIARIDITLGDIFLAEKDYVASYNQYLQALKYYKDQKDQLLIADIFVKLGSLALVEKKYENAEQYFSNANQLFREKKEKAKEALVYKELAYLAIEQEKYNEAYHYFSVAINKYENELMIDQMIELAIERSRIGLLIEKKDKDIELLQRYYSLMANTGHKKNMILLLLRLNEIYLNDNRDEYLDDLEKLLDEVPLSDFSLNLNHKLHNLYQQVGDKKKADEYWQDYWIQKSKLRERDKKYYQQAIGLYEQLLGKQVNEIEVLENEIKRNITIWVVVLLILWVIIFPIIKMKYLK